MLFGDAAILLGYHSESFAAAPSLLAKIERQLIFDEDHTIILFRNQMIQIFRLDYVGDARRQPLQNYLMESPVWLLRFLGGWIFR
jgi:hypothetical protein